MRACFKKEGKEGRQAPKNKIQMLLQNQGLFLKEKTIKIDWWWTWSFNTAREEAPQESLHNSKNYWTFCLIFMSILSSVKNKTNLKIKTKWVLVHDTLLKITDCSPSLKTSVTDLPMLPLSNVICSAPYLSLLEKPQAFVLPAFTVWDTASPQIHVPHPLLLLVRLSWLSFLNPCPTCTPTTHLVYTLLSRLHWGLTYLALYLLSHHGMLPWRKMCFYFQVCLQAPEGYKLQYRSPKNFRQNQQEQEEVCYATGLVSVLPRCKHLCHVQGTQLLRTQPHSLWGLISVINYNVGPK